MKFGLELPTSLLEEFNSLADFDYALAPSLLNDDAYLSFYQRSNRFKVVDCGANEKASLSSQDLVDVARRIGADLVGIPNEQENAFETLTRFLNFVPYLSEINGMAVVQGKTTEGIKKCAETYWEHGIKCFGISYTVLSGRSADLRELSKNRVEVVRFLLQNAPYDISIHLLGLATLDELATYKWEDSVVSLDTGHPVLFGLQGKLYGQDEFLRKNGFLGIDTTSVTDKQKDIIKQNILYLKKYL